MRRQFSLILTLCAWLLATGSHWDLVQTFAWGRMFATYSQSMTFTQAAKKTFSSDGMCGLCEIVSSSKHQQEAADARVPGNKAPAKIFLVSAPAALCFISPASSLAGVASAVTALVSAERPPPSLPPPRSGLI